MIPDSARGLGNSCMGHPEVLSVPGPQLVEVEACNGQACRGQVQASHQTRKQVDGKGSSHRMVDVVVAGALEHTEQTGVGITAKMHREVMVLEVLTVQRTDSAQ